MEDATMEAVRRTGYGPHGGIASDPDASPPTFLFILTPLDFEFEVPFDITPECTIRRAAEWELTLIRPMLRRIASAHRDPSWSYECEFIHTKKENGVSFHFEPLPKEKWRYTVFSVAGCYDDRPHLLERCAELLYPPIEIGFAGAPIRFEGGDWAHGYAYQTAKAFAWMDSPARNGERAKLVTKAEMLALADYWSAAQRLPTDSFIRRALDAFYQTRALPDFSDAIVLSMFGTIESLLTHKPNPTDTIDSITRQIRTKMKLLGRRFVRQLAPASYFDIGVLSKHDKLWNTLYAYRSTLAHGAFPDFTGEFKGLKNRIAVSEFLREATRLLLIESLKDGVFLGDLREC